MQRRTTLNRFYRPGEIHADIIAGDSEVIRSASHHKYPSWFATLIQRVQPVVMLYHVTKYLHNKLASYSNCIPNHLDNSF